MLVVNSDGTFEIDTINRLTSVGGEARPHFDAMAAHARDIREDGRGREERRTRFARYELHRLSCVRSCSVAHVANLLLGCFAAVQDAKIDRSPHPPHSCPCLSLMIF